MCTTQETKRDIKKKKVLSKLVGTFYRNALRSNLDLTSLADTKAGILISINGFILTVSVTASGFAIHNVIMSYAFISIIITSLGSIIFSVMAVKPRNKDKLVPKEYLDGYSSLLYYQDMADLSPEEYYEEVNDAIYSTKRSKVEMTSHLHILGAEIKKKYYWLKQAYRFFSIGLIISASFMIYALVDVEKTTFYNLSKGNVIYKQDKFYNVFEPSGVATMPDGKILIVEDESNARSLKLLEIGSDDSIVELGNLYLPKKLKNLFKKEIEDLEAITVDGNFVYAITSHSLSKNNQHKETREKFIMFTYEDGAINEFYIYSQLKEHLYKRFPEIFVNDIFSADTINIEGLSIDKESGAVLLAFRAPLLDTKAFIIEITNPKELFLRQESPKFSKPVQLNFNGLGIRDISYDVQKKGYWIIAGSSDKREFKFELWFWNKLSGELSFVNNQPDIGFAEGITVINNSSNRPALFIVEDNGQKPNKAAEYLIIDRESL